MRCSFRELVVEAGKAGTGYRRLLAMLIQAIKDGFFRTPKTLFVEFFAVRMSKHVPLPGRASLGEGRNTKNIVCA